MTGEGKITRVPQFRLKLLLTMQVIWVLSVLVLGGWWGYLVVTQADRIAELERLVGLTSNVIQPHRTQRMLLWESGVFFMFLLFSTHLFFGLYWREIRRAKGVQAFFAGLTHELRTPLTSIRLQAEAIAEASVANESQRELSAKLMEDTQRLEGQVERTLELARLEGGGPVFTIPLNLSMAVERVAQSWISIYRCLKVRNEIDPDCEVLADPGGMQVILKNLFDNSLKHCGQDSVEIRIRATREGGVVTLLYSDNGASCGDDPGEVRKLGELFQKGSRSQGAGVGLYLIRSLMERMGGLANFRGGRGFEVALEFQEGRGNG